MLNLSFMFAFVLRKLKTAFHDSEEKMPPQIAVCPPKIPEPVPTSNSEDDLYDDGQAVQASLNSNTDEVYDDGSTFQGDAQGNVEGTYDEFYDDVSSHPKSNIPIITEGLPKRVESDNEGQNMFCKNTESYIICQYFGM